jgi:hypothetical protein
MFLVSHTPTGSQVVATSPPRHVADRAQPLRPVWPHGKDQGSQEWVGGRREVLSEPSRGQEPIKI